MNPESQFTPEQMAEAYATLRAASAATENVVAQAIEYLNGEGLFTQREPADTLAVLQCFMAATQIASRMTQAATKATGGGTQQ